MTTSSMTNSVTDINIYKKIKHLSKDLQDLKELTKVLKGCINNLTKYHKYITIKKNNMQLINTLADVNRAISMKEDMLKTLKIRKDHE